MRELLFRAKNIITNDWVSGSGILTSGEGLSTIYQRNISGSMLDKAYLHFNVYSNTIGQFVGLSDKTGKYVFEGDICKIIFEIDTMYAEEPRESIEYFEVVWNKEELCFMADFGYDMVPLSEYVTKQGYLDVEVIGNIYDNQEFKHNKMQEDN